MYAQAGKLLEEGREDMARDIYLRGRSKKGQSAEDHAAWVGISLIRLEKGIPHGSPVVPILANLFLDELDEELLNKGYKYIRYADDFVRSLIMTPFDRPKREHKVLNYPKPLDLEAYFLKKKRDTDKDS